MRILLLLATVASDLALLWQGSCADDSLDGVFPNGINPDWFALDFWLAAALIANAAYFAHCLWTWPVPTGGAVPLLVVLTSWFCLFWTACFCLAYHDKAERSGLTKHAN